MNFSDIIKHEAEILGIEIVDVELKQISDDEVHSLYSGIPVCDEE